jgi:hypothetical protein
MFDLNIENYTNNELIELFELPQNFDNNILDIKVELLRENILNNKNLDNELKQKTLNFLSKAKIIILENNSKKLNNSFQEKIENFYNSSYELKTIDIENNDGHDIQKRKQLPYLSSYPSEFFSGVINPLKKRILKKNLNVDTRFRDNYYNSPSTNFNLTLPTNFNNVIQMQLTALEIPTTFYVISKQYGNNYFNIKIETTTNVISKNTIYIQDGNYNADNLILAINNQLNILGAPFSDIVFNFGISTGSGNGQTIIGINNPVNYKYIEIDFQADKNGIYDNSTPLPLKFGWLLGFRNGIYTNNLNYVSEGIIDLTGPKYLFLVVDDFNNNVNNNFFSAFNSSILNKNILARITLQSNTFNILTENNLNIINIPREYFGPVNLLNLNIQLLDEYGRIVDLNNMDFSFALNLTTIYDI